MLLPDEQIYLQARLAGSAPVVAARVAGASSPTEYARRLEADEKYKTALQVALRVNAHRQAITKEDVIDGMMDAVRMSASAFELVSAWREIGKLVHAYDHPKKTPTDGVDLEHMTDLELASLGAIEGEFVEFTDATVEHRPNT